VQAGGNVEVMVLAGVSGSYEVNLSDVQTTARAGAVLVHGGEAGLDSPARRREGRAREWCAVRNWAPWRRPGPAMARAP